MNYQFPQIRHIDDVLPHVQDRDEFVVAEKAGGYTVINYVVQTDSTFGSISDPGEAIRRECRGMIFDTASGQILHRRLHKFFNVGEREETQIDQFDLSQPHVILEKLDGSMITPLVLREGIRWATKMGVTEVAQPVERHVEQHPKYHQLARSLHSTGHTPIFEWCSRQQRIVVDYPEDQLVLIAVRDNKTGAYWSYQDLMDLAKSYGIPVVRAFPGGVTSMEQLMAHTRDLEGAEGYVVRFASGHMAKVKGEWYLQLHRAKDAISLEKNVVNLLAAGTVDDVRPFLAADDLERLERFEHEFWSGFRETLHEIHALYEQGRAQVADDRRAFAVDFVNHQPLQVRPFLFGMWADKPLQMQLLDTILKNCSSQTRVDQVRWIFRAHWLSPAQSE